jgi:hypothetical protein
MEGVVADDEGAHDGGKAEAPHQHLVASEVTFETEGHLHCKIDPKHLDVQTRRLMGQDELEELGQHGHHIHQPKSPNVLWANAVSGRLVPESFEHLMEPGKSLLNQYTRHYKFVKYLENPLNRVYSRDRKVNLWGGLHVCSWKRH